MIQLLQKPALAPAQGCKYSLLHLLYGLRQPAARSQKQSHGELCGGIGQDIRGVSNADPSERKAQGSGLQEQQCYLQVAGTAAEVTPSQVFMAPCRDRRPFGLLTPSLQTPPTGPFPGTGAACSTNPLQHRPLQKLAPEAEVPCRSPLWVGAELRGLSLPRSLQPGPPFHAALAATH